MGLLSFLKRSPSAGAAGPASVPPVLNDESIERARTRARHRLVGAVVLLGIAVIGFPLLFETQPRPIPVDLPIDIPKKDAVPPLALARPQADDVPGTVAGKAVADAPEEAARVPDVPEPVAPALPRPEPKPVAKAETKPAPKPEPKPEPRPEPKPAPKVEPKPDAKSPVREEARAPARSAETEAGRARALLEGRQPEAVRVETARTADTGGRFAVQIGAFSEGSSAREARQKVERLGLRSYTQEVETAEGRRIRVRVGPFTSRAEADQAAARLRAAGLPVAMLSQ